MARIVVLGAADDAIARLTTTLRVTDSINSYNRGVVGVKLSLEETV